MLRFFLKFVGFLLDDEYTQNPISQKYFAELEDVYRTANIVVPLTYNDYSGGSFINGTVRTVYSLVHLGCAMLIDVIFLQSAVDLHG